MVEPADAKELIDEAIERAEDERDIAESEKRAKERTFRDRVSLMVGVFAVALAIVHMAAAASARESLLKGIAASDSFAYMQAKIVRETVLKTAAAGTTGDAAERRGWAAEAARLRAPDHAGHGIGQLQKEGDALRRDGARAAAAGEGYEIGETALQLGIVLLSIALVARSRALVTLATLLALAGMGWAAATRLGIVAG